MAQKPLRSGQGPRSRTSRIQVGLHLTATACLPRCLPQDGCLGCVLCSELDCFPLLSTHPPSLCLSPQTFNCFYTIGTVLGNNLLSPAQDLLGGLPLNDTIPCLALTVLLDPMFLCRCLFSGCATPSSVCSLSGSLFSVWVSLQGIMEILHCPFSSCRIDH